MSLEEKSIVLIIDDSQANSALLSKALEKHFEVLLAQTGVQGLAMAQESQPDLILLETSLPGWDGYETCQHLKQAVNLANIPVLFILSTAKSPEQKLRCFEAGGADYVEIPFQEPELLARVFTHIELSHLRKNVEQAKKEAEEAANRAKNQFLVNLSHEMRTPINAVLGYYEMLKEEAEELKLSDFIPDLDRLGAAGKQLLGLINDVLDNSKIELGKMELHLETFNVETLLHEIKATIKPQIDNKSNAKSNAFQLRIVNALGEIYADFTKTRQILLNLLNHSAKVTQQGTIRLEARRKTLETTEWIEFRLSDDGIRLTPKRRQKLFQPFTSAHISIPRFTGTELWFIVAKKFLEMMGGAISVNISDEESTFTVHLPVAVTSL
jgi:two-component system sensor histidine kinase/response regulator